jgi:beta-lactamase class A
MKRSFLCFGVPVIAIMMLASCSAPQPDFMKMERELQAIVNEFNGDVGIYVEHLPSGRHIAIHADSVFPTASMIKVPIMTRIFERMELGELHYDSLHVYQDSLYYAGSDVVGSLKAGESISLHKLIFLMISFSDNTASLWLQHLAGTGTQINEQMQRLGLQETRVNSRTTGREQARGMYGWGQTTPREMATLLKMIRNGEVVSAAQSEEMYRIMSKSLWDKEALSQIPMHINAASKQGAVSASRSEVVLVNAPGGDYVFCVVTKNQQDRSWDNDNAGYVLIRNVSRVLWDGFNL